MDQMSRDSLVVLNNVLSENGSLQHEGGAVPTLGGLCVHIIMLFGAEPCR